MSNKPFSYWIWSALLIGLLVLLGVLAAYTMRAMRPAAPDVLSPVERGAHLYAAHCATCHGRNREGAQGVGPRLNAETLASYTHPDLENIVLFGRPEKGMPAFYDKISHNQMHYLEKFILQSADR